MFFFLCDGKLEYCKKRECYKFGGKCRHTTNRNHAKYGSALMPVKKIRDSLYQIELRELEKNVEKLPVLRAHS